MGVRSRAWVERVFVSVFSGIISDKDTTIMMRGPTYDEGYISRKMASLTPSFTAPHHAPAAYGRPPMGGYMQVGASHRQALYGSVPRNFQT